MTSEERRGTGVPERMAPWRWIALLVIAVCVAWMIAHFGGNERVIAAGVQPPQAATTGQSTASNQGGGNAMQDDIGKLTGSTDKQDLVNHKVKLNDVRVLSVTRENNFWAGSPDGQSIFVVQRHEAKLPDAVNTNMRVQPGDTVSLTGIVRAVPQGVEQQQAWGLKGADIQRLDRERIYVLANEVKKK